MTPSLVTFQMRWALWYSIWGTKLHEGSLWGEEARASSLPEPVLGGMRAAGMLAEGTGSPELSPRPHSKASLFTVQLPREALHPGSSGTLGCSTSIQGSPVPPTIGQKTASPHHPTGFLKGWVAQGQGTGLLGR